LPFFTLDEPFRNFLIYLARGDGKLHSIFNKIGVGHSFGYTLVDELIENNIIYIVNSRESSLKEYRKQLIKKEFRSYDIEPKVYFKKPFLRFWFLLVEPYRKQDKIDITRVLSSTKESSYRLSSLVYEQLSIELLKHKFKAKDRVVEYASYWDRFNEFDIYAKTQKGNYILGECKYKNRPVTNAELLKLEAKARQSGLRVDYYALFSKNGFTLELNKNSSSNLLLYELKEFKELLIL
jgi:hypothetical protein